MTHTSRSVSKDTQKNDRYDRQVIVLAGLGFVQSEIQSVTALQGALYTSVICTYYRVIRHKVQSRTKSRHQTNQNVQ